MSSKTLVNGTAATTVDALDRAVQYGDGLFETLAWRGTGPELWQAHLARLRLGCERLGISAPAGSVLRREVDAVAAGSTRCVVKLIVTRGSGGRGYRPDPGTTPTRIVAAFPWPDYPGAYSETGVAVRLCRTPLGLNPALAGVKHLNRLENVLARAEWSDPAIAEGLMCDPLGRVVEGTMTNLFLVRRGVLVTPELSTSGVAGVMRGAVITVAGQLGLAVAERAVTPAEVAAAEEAFLTNSLVRLWPVASVDGAGLPVRRPLTERLRQRLGEFIEGADGVEEPVV